MPKAPKKRRSPPPKSLFRDVAKSAARVAAPPQATFTLLRAGVDVPVESIDPHPLNPRREFGDLDGLAKSLQAGQLQEIVVRLLPQWGPDRYQLIAGERRLRAARLAKLPALRANVVDCTDADALELLGRENLEREQFNAIEEATWLKEMADTTGLSQRELSDHLQTSLKLPEGRQASQGWISNRLRLLNLPDHWQARIASGELPESHARDLATWADRPAVLEQLGRLDRSPWIECERGSEISLFELGRPRSSCSGPLLERADGCEAQGER